METTGFNQRMQSTLVSLGAAVQLLLATDRAEVPLGSLRQALLPAVRLEQICFAQSEEGYPVGYCTWAFVGRDTLTEFERDAGRTLEMAEWNEGTELLIIDVVAPFGHVQMLVDALKAAVSDHRQAVGMRDRAGRRRRASAVW